MSADKDCHICFGEGVYLATDFSEDASDDVETVCPCVIGSPFGEEVE